MCVCVCVYILIGVRVCARISASICVYVCVCVCVCVRCHLPEWMTMIQKSLHYDRQRAVSFIFQLCKHVKQMVNVKYVPFDISHFIYNKNCSVFTDLPNLSSYSCRVTHQYLATVIC